jgi:hypothetical protein
VWANGIVCVSWQQVSVGRHHVGARCDVHVDGELLQFWIGNDLVKTAARTSTGEVRTNEPCASATGPNQQHECQGSTETDPSTINRH